MSGIPAVERKRQEDQKFKANLSYVRPCLRDKEGEMFLSTHILALCLVGTVRSGSVVLFW